MVIDTSINNEVDSQLWNLIEEMRVVGRFGGPGAPLSSLRELLSVFLFLRWVDLREAEIEAMAIFENRDYQPLLSRSIQWRQLVLLEDGDLIFKLLERLSDHAVSLRDHNFQPLGSYLFTLSKSLRLIVHWDRNLLKNLIGFINDLPFETSGDRLNLLDQFDRLDSDWGRPEEGGEFSTAKALVDIVIAIAQPQPGERIYDPCFGAGQFLVASWLATKQVKSELITSVQLTEASGMEVNSNAFVIGLTRMVLAGIDSPKLEFGNCLEVETAINSDQHGFDLVLAHPPLNVQIKHIDDENPFHSQTTDGTTLFIQHCLSKLNRGGRAVIVVSESYLHRGGKVQEFRKLLIENGLVEAVIGLPPEILKPLSEIAVCILVIRKSGGINQVKLAQVYGKGKSKKNFVIDNYEVNSIRSALNNPDAWRNNKVQDLHSSMKLLRNHVSNFDLGDEKKQKFLEKLDPLFKHSKHSISKKSIYRNVWEIDAHEFSKFDWDLTPRRREKGVLEDILNELDKSIGYKNSVVRLADIVQVIPGRIIKHNDLLEEPPNDKARGYVRIKDLTQGKVGIISNWIRPDISDSYQSWALQDGDVLISVSGTVGKAAVVDKDAVGSLASRGLFILRPDAQRLDSQFLLAYLTTTACKTWLAAGSRGSAIQHLNRRTLDDLPIPLPPLQLQSSVATQYRAFGSDALSYLSHLIAGGENNRLSTIISKLDSVVPSFVIGTEETPELAKFEPILLILSEARNLVQKDVSFNSPAQWLTTLNEEFFGISGVAHIPLGTGLLSVLQDAEHGVLKAASLIYENTPIDFQARSICNRLSYWLQAVISDLMSNVKIRVGATPDSLVADSFAEFRIDLVNEGCLPIRNFRVETFPNWGNVEIPYLADRATISLSLSGQVSKLSQIFELGLTWWGNNLLGQELSGEIQIAIKVALPNETVDSVNEDLGGNPYVAGNPVRPGYGNDTFFGREKLLAKISRQISSTGNVVLLEGNRRSGKTSILYHLEGVEAIPGWLAVHASFQGTEGDSKQLGVPTPEIFRTIAVQIVKALFKLKIDAPLPNGDLIPVGGKLIKIYDRCKSGISAESPFPDFQEYLEEVLQLLEQRGLGLVLMLDEFDKLQEGIDNGITSPQVPENIRFLIQTYPRLSAILTGSRRLKRLRQEYWSALYGLGTIITVTALDEDSARSVVTQPVRDKLTYSTEAVNRIIEVAARQPYLMQCLCNRVFDFAVLTKSHSIKLINVNDAAANLVAENDHFPSLWNYAAEGPKLGRKRRQLILFMCATSFKLGNHITFGKLLEQLMQSGVEVNEGALEIDLTYLRELDLIDYQGEMNNGFYRLSIPLMADWIEKQQDRTVVISYARNETGEEEID